MRLGEIKSILEKVIDEDSQKILINSEPIFGGQAYIIKDYSSLISALQITAELDWNDWDFSQIQEILNEYGEAGYKAQITSQEYNNLNSYVSSLNSKIIFYYSILKTMTEKQDELAINIKLPSKVIDTLEDLNDFNKRLEKNLKRFNFDGGFRFSGFDKGSIWYVVIAVGVLTYRIFLACLKLAQEYLKTKGEYYSSKKAELDYKASLIESKNYDKKAFDSYVERRLELNIEEGISDFLLSQQIENGKTQAELQSQYVLATLELAKELSKGTEFHLSLNPPSYAREIGGALIIDYKSMPRIEKNKEEKKQIQAPKIETEEHS